MGEVFKVIQLNRIRETPIIAAPAAPENRCLAAFFDAGARHRASARPPVANELPEAREKAGFAGPQTYTSATPISAVKYPEPV
jgi:hypothetical protein